MDRQEPFTTMTFRILTGASVLIVCAALCGAAAASPAGEAAGQAGARKASGVVVARAEKKKKAAEPEDAKDDKKPGKPQQVGTFGDWGVFVAQGAKDKTCYALATPKERQPAKLKRDPAYVFISYRPAEKVRGEVSIIMGFSIKEGAESRADVGGTNFALVAKGANAWIKNPAEEAAFVEALKKGSKLIVKAPSAKGNVTTDVYSLSGISQALDKVQKECP